MRVFLISLLLTLSYCAPAMADERLRGHLAFIEANTDLVVDPDWPLPVVEYVDDWTLRSMVYPDQIAQCEFNGDFECSSVQSPLGAYHKNVVTVNADSGLTLAEQQVVLLHEMVHWIQDMEGRMPDLSQTDDSCVALPLEKEAYAVGQKYLDTLGIETDTVSTPSFWLAIWQSHCDNPRLDFYGTE